VVAHAPVAASNVIAWDDAFINSQHFRGLNQQSSFFESLARHSVAQRFAALEDASRQRPFAKQRRRSAPNQEHAGKVLMGLAPINIMIAGDNYRTHSHQR
jgi:hypothetical protein